MAERRRHRDNQPFLACINYPHCPYAKDIDESPEDKDDELHVGFDDDVDMRESKKRNPVIF